MNGSLTRRKVSEKPVADNEPVKYGKQVKQISSGREEWIKGIKKQEQERQARMKEKSKKGDDTKGSIAFTFLYFANR